MDGKSSLFFFVSLILISLSESTFEIIPQPVSLNPLPGHVFNLSQGTPLILPEAKTWAELGTYLQNVAGMPRLELITGSKWKEGNGLNKNKEKQKRIELVRTVREELGEEGYLLQVTSDRIQISAQKPAGAFYGLQTLLQLMDPKVYSAKGKLMSVYPIPGVDIIDFPSYHYRGQHLDVSRHFMPVEFVKKMIDLMALHKLNMFHWHLTDDQGWRVEIKQWPLLTKVGGYRKETNGDGKAHGGYYSQDQIKDVVSYASSRFITIIPEIGLPGHFTAALASYPQLGNTNKSIANANLEVATTWGNHPHVLFPQPVSFKFVEEVFGEVMALFPGRFIHIGGDEFNPALWHSDPRTAELMLRRFLRFVDKVVRSGGRRSVGWGDVLKTAKLRKDVMITNWNTAPDQLQSHTNVEGRENFYYFNWYQQQNFSQQPMAFRYTSPLENTYQFDPQSEILPPGREALIWGIQGSMWTEFTSLPAHVEYQVWPRQCALAEVAWTPKSRRKLPDFKRRLSFHKLRLDSLEVNYFGSDLNSQYLTVLNGETNWKNGPQKPPERKQR